MNTLFSRPCVEVELPEISPKDKTNELNNDLLDVYEFSESTISEQPPEFIYDPLVSIERHRHCKHLTQNQLYRLELKKQKDMKFMSFKDHHDIFGQHVNC